MSFRDKARQRLQERRQAAQPADGQDEQQDPPPDEPEAESDQPTESAPAQADYTAELEKLAKLKDEGILTDDEYAAKKKQILGI